MKFYHFTFNNEAIWSMIFNLIGFVVGGIILLAAYVLRGLN